MRSFRNIVISQVPRILRVGLTFIAIAISIEVGYRIYLYLKHPDYFTTTEIDMAEFGVMSASEREYDARYGYRYIPSLRFASTTVKGGKVIACAESESANEQGNFGPPVPDFDGAE